MLTTAQRARIKNVRAGAAYQVDAQLLVDHRNKGEVIRVIMVLVL